MKLNLIRRMIAIAALSAAALTGAVASADPLPVPDVPKLSILPVQDLYSPPDGVTVTYNNVFTWGNAGTPAKFKLKVTILQSGKKFTVPATQANCHPGDFCTMAASAVPGLFDALKDGDQVKWRVIAIYGKTKIKSAPRTNTFDTVSAPTTLLPANGALLMPVHNLSWNPNTANKSYVLVVKDAEDGVLISKQKLSSGTCIESCAVSAMSLGALPSGITLNWFVKAVGHNGNVAKSAKQTLVTPQLLIDQP
jgi:hypothetical protein